MERLNLRMGRFIPRAEADAETRIRALETHLGGLTAELEYLLAEINATLKLLESAKTVQGASATDADAAR